MRGILLIPVALTLLGCSAASRSPDAIRGDSAAVTAAAARDGKAVVLGVFDGLRGKGPINVNKATTEQILNLPGIDEPLADKIVAGRPYASSTELLRRKILTRRQYDQIAAHVVAR